MMLDMNLFSIGMVELMNKKILVRTDQASQPGDWHVEGEHAVKAS
jgi:hypothetical protein